ncbi:MAG: hypothetical protein U0531_21470 [Dehalococcoidia bacterium]
MSPGEADADLLRVTLPLRALHSGQRDAAVVAGAAAVFDRAVRLALGA